MELYALEELARTAVRDRQREARPQASMGREARREPKCDADHSFPLRMLLRKMQAKAALVISGMAVALAAKRRQRPQTG